MLFLLDCVSIGLPLSHSLGIAAPAHLRLRAAGAAAAASERAQIRGSLLDFTAPFRVRGAAGAGRDGMGWDGKGMPDFPIARSGLISRRLGRDGSVIATTAMTTEIDR